MELNIKKILLKKNMSEVELANMVNASKQYINALANGKGNPTISKLQKIADALEVDVIELLGGRKNNESSNCKCPHCGKDIVIILEKARNSS